MNADVLVVGGGAAGIAAAVGAAREGADVLLVERLGFLGGMATAALVGTVCGSFLRGEAPVWASGGFPRDFVEALADRSGTAPVGWQHGLWFVPYEASAFRDLADHVVAEAGARALLHATLLDLSPDLSYRLLVWDRVVEGRCRTVVDTSGVGWACAALGLPRSMHEPFQAPAFVFGLGGLPAAEPHALRLFLMKELRSAVQRGVVPEDAAALSIVPGTLRDGGRALFKLGLLAVPGDDPSDVSRLERRARAGQAQIVAFLRGLPGWGGLHVTEQATQLGLRTGPRPVGRHVLTADEVLNGASFEDGVAVGAWPIERWGADARPVMRYAPEGAHYEIPARCLRVEGRDDVFFAGRGLSATEDAAASARVIGTCLGTGYAAGALAASTSRGRPEPHALATLRAGQIQGAL